jgi:hypothetical protein
MDLTSIADGAAGLSFRAQKGLDTTHTEKKLLRRKVENRLFGV